MASDSLTKEEKQFSFKNSLKHQQEQKLYILYIYIYIYIYETNTLYILIVFKKKNIYWTTTKKILNWKNRPKKILSGTECQDIICSSNEIDNFDYNIVNGPYKYTYYI